MYNNKLVKNGEKFLTINHTKNEPIIDYNYYTLLMMDPDAPTRNNPIYSNWIHWLIIITKNNNGLNPPINTGLHIYFTLLVKQTNIIKNNLLNKRDKFNLYYFINQHKLNINLII